MIQASFSLFVPSARRGRGTRSFTNTPLATTGRGFYFNSVSILSLYLDRRGAAFERSVKKRQRSTQNRPKVASLTSLRND